MGEKRKPATICIQSGWKPKNGEPRVLPIYQSTTFKYETSEQMGRLFDLDEDGYFYTSASGTACRCAPSTPSKCGVALRG